MFDPGEYLQVPIKFTKGIVAELPTHLVGLDACWYSRNFSFENGVAITRPGVKVYKYPKKFEVDNVQPVLGSTIYSSPGASDVNALGPQFMFFTREQTGVLAGGSSPTTVPPRLWVLNRNGTYQEVIGPSGVTSLYSVVRPAPSSIAVVNGAVLFAGMRGEIQRWVPGDTTYSSLSVGYKYVVGHKSRAVAAFKLPGNPYSIDRYTVGWSTAGDETNWSSFGSGSAVLADAGTDITGLVNIRDVIVVGRPDGFHLGEPTGKANPAFSWRRHSINQVGPIQSTAFISDGTQAYFIGEDNVYSFDLVEVNPIGTAIRGLLLNFARQYIYRAAITRSVIRGASRRLLHFVPVGTLMSESGPFHFVFNIDEGTWAVQEYKTQIDGLGGFAFSVDPTQEADRATFGFGGVDGIRAWDWDSAPQSECSLKANFVVDQVVRDLKLEKVILRYSSVGSTNAKLTVSAIQNGVLRKSVVSLLLPASPRSLSDVTYWYQKAVDKWVPIESVAGKLHELELVVDGATKFAVHQLTACLSDSGEQSYD